MEVKGLPFRRNQKGEALKKDWFKAVDLASLETIWPQEYRPSNSPSFCCQAPNQRRAFSRVSKISPTRTLKFIKPKREHPIKFKVATCQAEVHILNFHRIRPQKIRILTRFQIQRTQIRTGQDTNMARIST